jgi:glutathione peroxidase-family protein
MFKKSVLAVFAALCAAGLTNPVVFAGEAAIGAPAPLFSLPDSRGTQHSLQDYRGKYVVLEWVNFDCPFVHKHYGSGAMQQLQHDMEAKGIIWLSICSSAPGKQGYFEGEALHERMNQEHAGPTAYLVDPEGNVGKMYSAKTTPHMFIIDPEGNLIYAGGIDNIASTDQDDIGRATNYVRADLDAALAGKPIPYRVTKSYGCSVKYK